MKNPALGGAREQRMSGEDIRIITRPSAKFNLPTIPDDQAPPLAAYAQDPEVLGLDPPLEAVSLPQLNAPFARG